MKKTVFFLCLILFLLCGCAPRAREYSAIATAGQTPLMTQTASRGTSLANVQTQDPPARFAVPAGWTVEPDTGLYTLTRSGLNATIEFMAMERIHPDYTYKKELSALEASVKRCFADVEITYKNKYYVLGGYSGIEILYTYTPADAQTGQKTSHAVILFSDGYEYSFVLTSETTAFLEGEQAFKEILFSLELG